MRTVLLLIPLTAACAAAPPAAPPAAPGEIEQPREQVGPIDSGYDHLQDIRRRLQEAGTRAQADQPGAPRPFRVTLSYMGTATPGTAPMPFGGSMFGPWDVGTQRVFVLEAPERPVQGPLPPIPSDD